MKILSAIAILLAVAATAVGAADREAPSPWTITEADYVVPAFRFHTGETMKGMKIHYATLGTPRRDAQGHITNAILLLHGTGGTGRGLISAAFGNRVFGPGQVFDIARYYIVLPDAIGHGGTAKPSDGLRTGFPKYDYLDMVNAQHALAEHLGIARFELVGGHSMGCMHSWVWATTYPDAMKRLLPLSCIPTEIAGRNRLTRKMVIEAIRSDPAYQDGNYSSQPLLGLRAAAFISSFSNTTAAVQQRQFPTRAAADAEVDRMLKAVPDRDANDMIYQYDASRDYDPEPDLGKIRAKILWINSADDLVNPVDGGEVSRLAAKLKPDQFMLIPDGPDSIGHGTAMKPELWGDRVMALMRE